MSRRGVWASWLLSGEQVEAQLRSVDAWLTGHFVLASERHSREYVTNDPLFEEKHKEVLDLLAHALAAKILLSEVLFDAVTGPAEGGLKLASRVAAILARETDRPIALILNHKEGKEFLIQDQMTRVRALEGGTHFLTQDLGTPFTVVLLEDTVTTGGSLMRYAEALRNTGSEVALCVAIFNREGRTATQLGFPRFEHLLEKRIESLDSEDCAECGPCSTGPEINEQHGHGAAFVQRYGQRPRKGNLGTGP